MINCYKIYKFVQRAKNKNSKKQTSNFSVDLYIEHSHS